MLKNEEIIDRQKSQIKTLKIQIDLMSNKMTMFRNERDRALDEMRVITKLLENANKILEIKIKNKSDD